MVMHDSVWTAASIKSSHLSQDYEIVWCHYGDLSVLSVCDETRTNIRERDTWLLVTAMTYMEWAGDASFYLELPNQARPDPAEELL
jgi:hypothetical protein